MAPAPIPTDVGRQLLQDPAVQKTIQDLCLKTGRDAASALQDPVVQRQILQTCRAKFPEYATQASLKINEFVNDPQVQSQARALGALATQYLGQAANQAGSMFVAQIQQGPAGVRVLAFCGGLASFSIAFVAVLDPARLPTHSVSYVLDVYQAPPGDLQPHSHALRGEGGVDPADRRPRQIPLAADRQGQVPIRESWARCLLHLHRHSLALLRQPHGAAGAYMRPLHGLHRRAVHPAAPRRLCPVCREGQ
mmetsp:Transcript_22859/g.60384  ORF Transcript_22859/g.60384 Transcript_22859/m.60384 type:complete len:250 (-) Transcript_22859:108-857(-)